MNDGFINESVLREYINNNSFQRYNENIKAFLIFIFQSNLNPTLDFVAKKETGQVKPDLYIKHNGIIKHISIKKGSGNSVHQEKIEKFFPFIEELLGYEQLNNLKKFHYGDDTINDSGTIRYNAKECKVKYFNEIKKLNLDFNKKENLSLFLDRFLFVGNIGITPVDFIYHGTIEKGLWASKDEIKKYFYSNKFSLDALHFGALTYQVWGRNEKRTAIHPERRYIMQIKWGNITNDLKKIREENL